MRDGREASFEAEAVAHEMRSYERPIGIHRFSRMSP